MTGHSAAPGETRRRLDEFLYSCTRETLLHAFSERWLNDIIPGIQLLIGCDQGRLKHLEGDAAVHIALVLEHLEEAARQRLGREPEFIERLSVLLHDLKKPQTRIADPDGRVRFPGHEEQACVELPGIAASLELTHIELERMEFAIRYHGVVNNWPALPQELRNKIRASPWRYSLALLHEADARSCLTPAGHAPFYWSEICAAP